MAAVLEFARAPGLPALPDAPAAEQLPEFARAAALERLAMIRPAINRVEQGVSLRAAADWLRSQLGETAPSLPTIRRWIADFREGGLAKLAPQYTGRPRKDYGWELRAQALYREPTCRLPATVAYKLRQAGWDTATNSRVRRYLASLPSNLAETNPQRLGRHFYNQNVKPYVIRDTTSLPAGLVYEADGHCCDVYVQHPATGKHFRPELTVWMDVATRFVVGWWLSEAESAQTTLFSLSYALRKHNHVPAFVHVDRGSGFKSKLMTAEVTGFLQRFSIEPIFALPRNAKGKGLIEGSFRWLEERCGKDFPTHCGGDRTDDGLQRMEQKIRRGELAVPTLAEYAAALEQYFDAANNTPHSGIDGAIPAELWAALERTPVVLEDAAIVRPRETCTVKRWRVRLHNRFYEAPRLTAYVDRQVQVEYCLHDDRRVWIYDLKGRFVAEAPLVEKREWLPQSRVEEGQQRRLKGQHERLQRKVDEAEARSRRPLMLADLDEALDAPIERALPAPGEQLLDRGHSFEALPQQPTPERVPRALRQDVRDQVAAELAAAELAEETPQQRFARAVSLQAARDAGDYLEPEEAEWLSSYLTTSEYRGQRLVYDEFNAA
jgi:putative transposase